MGNSNSQITSTVMNSKLILLLLFETAEDMASALNLGHEQIEEKMSKTVSVWLVKRCRQPLLERENAQKYAMYQ